MEQYESQWQYHEGLAGVRQNGKWGYINTEKHLIIPCLYDEIKHFSNALACVRRKGLWGYVNTLGEEVILCQYDEAHDFKSCGAIVKQGNLYGVIDSDGDPKLHFAFEIIESFKDGYAKVKANGKYGVVDCEGKIVIACEYQRIMKIDSDLKNCLVKTFSDQCETVVMNAKNLSITDLSKLEELNQRLITIEKEIVEKLSALELHLSSLCEQSAIDDYELNIEVYFYIHDIADPLCQYDQYCKKDSENLYGLADGVNHNEFYHWDWHPMYQQYHCWIFHSLYDHLHIPFDIMMLIEQIDWDIIVRYQYFDR